MRFAELVSSSKPPKSKDPLIDTNNCTLRNNAEFPQRFKNIPNIFPGSNSRQNNQHHFNVHPSYSGDVSNLPLHRPVARKLSPGYRHPKLTGFPKSSIRSHLADTYSYEHYQGRPEDRIPPMKKDLSQDNQPIVMIPAPRHINSEQSEHGSN